MMHTRFCCKHGPEVAWATARFASPLGTEDYVKRSSVIEYSPSGLAAALPHLGALARVEGLAGHGQAAELRARRPADER